MTDHAAIGEPSPRSSTPLRLHRAVVLPDESRTIPRPFEPGYPEGFEDAGRPRGQVIVERILALDAAELDREIAETFELLNGRHEDVEGLLLRRFDALRAQVNFAGATVDRRHRLLIASYFTEEYAFEAAALFNPSAVLHPEQDGLPEGVVRFVLGLRAIGEGHVSSLAFRTGMWQIGGSPVVDEIGRTTQPPIVVERGGDDDVIVELHCGGSRLISENVLFPLTDHQKQGIEDVRFTRFVDDDRVTFYGTYTAFDGRDARSELLVTEDFRTFQMRALSGRSTRNKGMALFPRKVDGRFAMLGRQDNESIWLLTSDDVLRWEDGAKIIQPRYPWEFVQMGNCGPPIEVDEGWLVLTHGVGKVRNYAMGACLLDRRDPTRLLARTPRPILSPGPGRRDGYVPNVVYSCGAIAVDRHVLIPYAVADTYTAFASTTVDALLEVME